MGNQICGHGEPGQGFVHQLHFPMYVVKLRDFMLMKGTPKDFQLLLYAGLLYEWRMGMRTIFVSHQWLSRIHPDPKGEQIQVLRDALGKLMDAGFLEIH